jgi:methylenetetrahydrofolate--tRNA-(uracil-5-)-methyltransferase
VLDQRIQSAATGISTGGERLGAIPLQQERIDMITVVGGGLAGSEAAWQAAQLGVPVVLYEMRPGAMTPAHHSGHLGELVCSNSLGSNLLSSPAGLLKEELRRLGSVVIEAADAAAVPAGGALAVDRERYAAALTKRLEEHPLIRIERVEVRDLPDSLCIVASGPLTSPALADRISAVTGAHDLYFYDAAAPIVTGESINTAKGFWAGRYGKGGADYFNCPFTEEEYLAFWEALVKAEKHESHIDEPLHFFAGCLPIEEIAARGRDTLRFGPLRPVGLTHPITGRRPYAVAQLRRENTAGTLFNLVGFQTRLTWSAQKRVFRLIPGLEEAEFVRYGVMHRNTYLNSPRVLQVTGQLKGRPHLLFAGQITGVEGYVESTASGLIAGINAARLARGLSPRIPPPETMTGALLRYIVSADPDHFQPMNANFGLLPPYPGALKRRERKAALVERALASVTAWREADD